LKWEADIDAERSGAAGPILRRTHNPISGSRDDHPALCSDTLREGEGLLPIGLIRCGPGAAKHGDLSHRAVGREHPEGMAKLLQPVFNEPEYPAHRSVTQQAHGSNHDLPPPFWVARGAIARLRSRDQLFNPLVQFGFPQFVALTFFFAHADQSTAC